MTTFAMTTAPINDSNADFQAWITPLFAGMAAIGWVKTSDTGQLDPTTAIAPGTSTSAGYQIWEMSDSLQSTAPCFLKIEVGTASSANDPAIWLTLGTGSDGSGNLTGQVSARIPIFSGGATGTAAFCAFSGTPSRVTASLWPGAGGGIPIAFTVERAKSVLGLDTANGFMIVTLANGMSSVEHQYVPATGNLVGPYTVLNCCVVPTGSGTFGSNVNLYPVKGNNPGETAPVLGFAGYVHSDLAASLEFFALDWAENGHTYYSTGGSSYPTQGGDGDIAVLYE